MNKMGFATLVFASLLGGSWAALEFGAALGIHGGTVQKKGGEAITSQALVPDGDAVSTAPGLSSPLAVSSSSLPVSRPWSVRHWLSAEPSQASDPYHLDGMEFLPLGDGTPKAVAIGDVNGDHRADLVVSTGEWFGNFQGNSIFIYLQRSDGQLADPLQIKYADMTTQWTGLAVGDLDHDGVDDIVVGHDHGLAIIRGSAGVYAARNYTLPMAVENVSLVDLDQDGILDIVGLSPDAGATLLYGDGRASVRQTEVVGVPSIYGWNDMKVGDVTGDGLPDLVITSDYSPSLVILPGVRSGGLGSPIIQSLSTEYFNPEGNAVGDFNGDGLNDVAMTVSQNSPAYLRVFSQDAAGALSAEPTLLSSYDIPGPLISADLDNDGRQDLVTVHDGWGALGYYLQRNGSMQDEILVRLPITSTYRPTGLAAGDLDGDGCLDIAVAGTQRGVLVIHGQGCVSRPHVMSGPSPFVQKASAGQISRKQ